MFSVDIDLDWTVVLLFDMGFVWRIFSVDILIIEI
jgi:hypothetical protein